MMEKPVILFMAKTINEENWIEGSYFWSEKENKHFILGESIDYGFQKKEIDPTLVYRSEGELIMDEPRRWIALNFQK